MVWPGCVLLLVAEESGGLSCLTGLLIPPRFECLAVNCTALHWIPGSLLPLPGYNKTVAYEGSNLRGHNGNTFCGLKPYGAVERTHKRGIYTQKPLLTTWSTGSCMLLIRLNIRHLYESSSRKGMACERSWRPEVDHPQQM